MNFLQRVAAKLSGVRTPTITQNPYNEAFLWGAGGGYTTYDPANISYLEQGYNANPFVFAMINQMSNKTASIPFSLKEIKDESAAKNFKELQLLTKGDMTMQQMVKSRLMEHKAFEESDMPFPMERPNVNQTWKEFLALYKTFFKVTGNAYIYMLTPGIGMEADKPIQVYLLPSQYMQIVLKHNASLLGVEDPIDHYMLMYGRSFIKFSSENVIHIKRPNPNFGENGEHLYGQSELRAALKNIESSNTAMDLNIKTLKNGGAFGFVHPKGGQTALRPEQAREIKDRLLEMNANPEELSKIAGYSVELGFTRLSLTSDELKPFDYLKFDRQQIADVLNWSVDDGNRGDFGGTMQEIKKARIVDNIYPDLQLLEQALNEKFLPRFKGYEKAVINFDITELPEMQTDLVELSKWLNAALDRATINRDEYRIAIGYTPTGTEEMARFTVSNDIISLTEALDNDFQTEPPKQE
jgi:phage portal protein BeeE